MFCGFHFFVLVHMICPLCFAVFTVNCLNFKSAVLTLPQAENKADKLQKKKQTKDKKMEIVFGEGAPTVSEQSRRYGCDRTQIRSWHSCAALAWLQKQEDEMNQRLDELTRLVQDGHRLLYVFDRLKHDSALHKFTMDYEKLELLSKDTAQHMNSVPCLSESL